ncbi:MAG: hypothetical protein M3O86_04320, partial [Actinomycetota bacterium]|nr:hypothetical protein [Actinomycetota bacterium]
LGVPRASRAYQLVSLVRVRTDVRGATLLGESFDLTEHAHEGRYDVIAWPGDRARLEAAGYEYDVVVEDLVGLDIRERLAEAAAQEAAPQQRMTYRVLANYNNDMRRLETLAPDLVKLVTLPNKTHQGRDVLALEIGGNIAAAATDGRPQSLLMGLHHAREWPSAELTMMFAEDLVDSYLKGDAEIKGVLDQLRLFVIPVVNPDGFVRSRETVSDFVAPLPGAAAVAGEFAYHRKNMRPHTVLGRSELAGTVQQGVDPNRNYPYKWGGPGASGSTSVQTYYGPGPGSEPEIKNILSILRNSQVLTLISNHTYSDLVLRPFGDTRANTPDEKIIKGHADAMAEINGYRSIKGIELYVTTGTTEDWVYGTTGALSFTFEIGANGVTGFGNTTPADGQGFHPQYNLHIPAFYARNRGAFLLNLKEALNPLSHVVLTGTAPAGTVLTLDKVVEIPLSRDFEGKNTLTERLSSSMTVNSSGRYTWHVNPSPMPQTVLDGRTLETYTLRAALPDGTVTEQSLLALRGESYTRDFA